MTIDQTHIAKIRTAFEKMQTKEDFLQLLNDVKPLVYGNKAVPFELKQLTWYANPKLATKRYVTFKIKKKSGSERTIHAPVKGLKSLQKTLSFILQSIFEPHHAAMGFVRSKSIVNNARIHEGSRYVYNIDLKDFFPSIDQARVWKCLQLRPFDLNKKNSKDLPSSTLKEFSDFIFKSGDSLNFVKENGQMVAKTKHGLVYKSENLDEAKIQYIVLNQQNIKKGAQ